MSEENSWRQYKKDLSRQIKANGRCIIFLGVFLSHVVRYESYHKLRRKSSSFSVSSTRPPPLLQRKSSVYMVLDAITVRQRIESLRLSQPGAVGERYSRPSGSLLDHALTLDIESSRSTSSQQHNHLSILTDGLLDINEEGETHILSGTDGEGSLSDGDVSPDLCEREWSEEVLSEVERRTRLRSQTPTQSVLRKGYSLDQLLSACELEEEVLELGRSRSQSMSHLLSSSTLQQWTDDEFRLESDLSTSRLTNGIEERDNSNSLQNGICENGICEQENGLRNESDYPKSRRITHYTTSFSDLASGKVSRPSRQSLPHTYLRKRHTASDEMHLLQLHIAKEEPTTDPAVMLKQYQLLSLGYSVTITSAPYIRTLLDHFETTSDLEAYHYRRSYLLESL